jgi:outer membrane receptor for ferric coprogen and ferric-rhodotorulic acid
MNASSTENSFQTYYGGLANHTVEALAKRLILTGSVRNDWVKLHQQQPLSPNVRLRDARQGDSQFTYSTGVSYHLVPRKLVAYGSYGSIFQPSPEVDPNTGSILGNRTGRGGEIGFKGVLLNDRLSYSASAYRVQQDNVTTANPANPTGANPALPALVAGSGTKGEGLSFDFSGSLTRDISLLGNVAWGNVYIYKNVASPALVGTPPFGTQSPPSRTGAVALRYSPAQGVLKGWKAGLTYQYVSTTQRLARTVNAAGVITAYDLWLPEKSEWGAVVGYRRRLGGQRVFNASLNVNNLLDRRTLWVSGNSPLGREFRGTVSLNF